MRKNLMLAAALFAVGVAVPAVAAKPPHPSKGSKLTMTVKPNPLVFGHYATVSGSLTGSPNAGIAVELQTQAYPYTGGYVTRGTKPTDAKGNVSFAIAPDRTSHVRLVTQAAPKVTSNVDTLSVAWRVGLSVSDSTPAKGAFVRFSGSVHPANPGGSVLVQKRTSTGWKTVTSTTLKAATASYSTYRKSLRIRSSGTYRTRVPGDAAHLAGTSRTRTLSVH